MLTGTAVKQSQSFTLKMTVFGVNQTYSIGCRIRVLLDLEGTGVLYKIIGIGILH